MKTATRRAVTSTVALLLSATALAGCSNSVSSGGNGASTGTTPSAGASSAAANAKIGLLLPDNDNARYASADYPLFKQEVATKCPTCTVVYQNAGADASKQQQQAQAMLTQGVKVLVIAAQDGKAAAQIVRLAKQKNVPVLAYDRLIDSADLAGYISFDNEKVGRLQAQALVDRMKKLNAPTDAGYLEVNGSPTDPNAGQFKAGAESVLSKSGYKQLAEYDTPDWLPAKAQSWAQGSVSKVGGDKVMGVYAANDSVGAAVATALKGAGVKTLPPITGQDASLAGIQNILSGTQYMTIYKAFKPEAFGAADDAVMLAQGQTLSLPTTAKTASGASVPATLLNPVAVTASNIQATVVKDGLYKASQICTSAYKAACATNGIK